MPPMDHADAHAPCSSSPRERLAAQRRKAEPVVFFFGLLAIVAVVLVIIVCTGRAQVGPDSAQREVAADLAH